MLDQLYSQAKELAGRDIEVERTRDGKYVVLYMSFTQPPPPKGKTEEEALKLFIEYRRQNEDRIGITDDDDTTDEVLEGAKGVQ